MRFIAFLLANIFPSGTRIFKKVLRKIFFWKKFANNELFLKYATNMPICRHMPHEFSMKLYFELCHIYEFWHINMPPGNHAQILGTCFFNWQLITVTMQNKDKDINLNKLERNFQLLRFIKFDNFYPDDKYVQFYHV